MFSHSEDVEEWRIIEDFPNYLISNFGRVMIAKTGRIKKLYSNPAYGKRSSGYVTINLYNDVGASTKKVHRLVAQSFLIQSGDEVNHIDGDKSNNAAYNLEWVTRQENHTHARNNGYYDLNGEPKKPIRIIETGEEFESITACAKAINGRHSGIYQQLKGLYKTHMGYTFELLKED